ncbi:hypothetical protein EV177_000694 [Coemansia sp. RSA 1804]|nr:hypothetical protein EV177_000694 [Coemansia sp. RSA 1804]
MNEADEEFDRARQKSQGRFRSAFEAIFEKYGQIDEDDDIINLETGDFIVDNGRVRNSRVIELGDLLRYSDQPSSPLLDGSSYPPSSPELLSNNQIERKKEQSAHNGNRSDQDEKEELLSQSSDEESGSIDLDFASYINKYSTSSGHASGAGPLWKRRQKTESDEDEEEESIDYDSSDSLAADQEATPIEMYFTNSIEQYLEKLRQQMSAPRPMRSHTQSPTTTTTSTTNTTTNITASDQQIHDDARFENGGAIASRYHARTTRMYEIPSSPRTMTSRGSSDGAHTRPFASSPVSSVYSDEDAAISESSIISSTHSPDHSPHARMYFLPPVTSTTAEQQQRTAEYQDSLYFDTNLHHSAAFGYSSVEYEGEEDSEDPVSEEEPIEVLDVYTTSNSHYDHHTSNAHLSMVSDEFPPSYQTSSFSLSRDNSRRVLNPPATTNSSPVLCKPQPVAPHVFFNRDMSLDDADDDDGYDDDSGFTPDPPYQEYSTNLPNNAVHYPMLLQMEDPRTPVQRDIDSNDSASIHSSESLDSEWQQTESGFRTTAVGIEPTHNTVYQHIQSSNSYAYY